MELETCRHSDVHLRYEAMRAVYQKEPNHKDARADASYIRSKIANVEERTRRLAELRERAVSMPRHWTPSDVPSSSVTKTSAVGPAPVAAAGTGTGTGTGPPVVRKGPPVVRKGPPTTVDAASSSPASTVTGLRTALSSNDYPAPPSASFRRRPRSSSKARPGAAVTASKRSILTRGSSSPPPRPPFTTSWRGSRSHEATAAQPPQAAMAAPAGRSVKSSINGSVACGSTASHQQTSLTPPATARRSSSVAHGSTASDQAPLPTPPASARRSSSVTRGPPALSHHSSLPAATSVDMGAPTPRSASGRLSGAQRAPPQPTPPLASEGTAAQPTASGPTASVQTAVGPTSNPATSTTAAVVTAAAAAAAADSLASYPAAVNSPAAAAAPEPAGRERSRAGSSPAESVATTVPTPERTPPSSTSSPPCASESCWGSQVDSVSATGTQYATASTADVAVASGPTTHGTSRTRVPWSAFDVPSEAPAVAAVASPRSSRPAPVPIVPPAGPGAAPPAGYTPPWAIAAKPPSWNRYGKERVLAWDVDFADLREPSDAFFGDTFRMRGVPTWGPRPTWLEGPAGSVGSVPVTSLVGSAATASILARSAGGSGSLGPRPSAQTLGAAKWAQPVSSGLGSGAAGPMGTGAAELPATDLKNLRGRSLPRGASVGSGRESSVKIEEWFARM